MLQWLWDWLGIVHWGSFVTGLFVGGQLMWVVFVYENDPHSAKIKSARLMSILDFAAQQRQTINHIDMKREPGKRDATGVDWALLYDEIDPDWRDFN